MAINGVYMEMSAHIQLKRNGIIAHIRHNFCIRMDQGKMVHYQVSAILVATPRELYMQ